MCNCITASGKKCSRAGSKEKGLNPDYCFQHQGCEKDLSSTHKPKNIPTHESVKESPSRHEPAHEGLKVTKGKNLNDFPLELQLMVFKEMDILTLTETRLLSHHFKVLIDTIINERFNSLFPSERDYTIKNKINKLQYIFLKEMNIDTLIEKKRLIPNIAEVVDKVINDRFKDSFSFPEDYTMAQKINKLKISEIYDILMNTDNYIYGLFESLSSGNVMYIKNNTYVFNDNRQPYEAEVRSGASNDVFYNFVERNANKFNLLKLTHIDIIKSYKTLFLKHGSNSYYF